MTRYMSLFWIIPKNKLPAIPPLPVLACPFYYQQVESTASPLNPGWPFDLFIPIHCSGWDTL